MLANSSLPRTPRDVPFPERRSFSDHEIPGSVLRSGAHSRSPSPTMFDPRYPPFDFENPFAALSELRQRSYSLILEQMEALAVSEGKFELLYDDTPGQGSADACIQPSNLQQRHAAVSLPTSAVYALCGDTLPLTPGVRPSTDIVDESGTDTDSRNLHQDHIEVHHRPFAISVPSGINAFTSLNPSTKVKQHYQTRRSSGLYSPQIPPLTPDLSGSSSGSSSMSLLDTPLAMPRTSRSEVSILKIIGTPMTGLVEKLLAKRNGDIFPRSRSLFGKRELPTISNSIRRLRSSPALNEAVSIPFPRTSSMINASDISLGSRQYLANQTSTMPCQWPMRSSDAFTLHDYHLTSQLNSEKAPLNSSTDTVMPPLRTRLFSLTSRSLVKLPLELRNSNGGGNRHPRTFDEHSPPTPEQIQFAASLQIVSENGLHLRFGDLWEDKKTIVIFIRHFRCFSCQGYIRTIASEVNAKSLEEAGLSLIVVGLGPYTQIEHYRALTGIAFPIYTDPSLAVHKALGMTLKNTDPVLESERGHYANHRKIRGISRTLKDAVTMRLPMFSRGGDIAQLGGEFILGPGQTCDFAHRMKNTQSHSPIRDIINAFSVQNMRKVEERAFLNLVEDEEEWMIRRRQSLLRLRRKRQSRRAGTSHLGLSWSADDTEDPVEVETNFSTIHEAREFDEELDGLHTFKFPADIRS